MKKLEKSFVMNADKVGDNTFTQIKREGQVAIYQRTDMDGEHRSYEVFIIKCRYKGQPLPGGQVEKEDRECYPGAASFGKIAYDCKTLDRAEERFAELLVKVKESEDNREEAERTGKPVRKGRKPSKESKTVAVPKGKFTMKFLMGETGSSQPILYPIVKRWIAEGVVKVVGEHREEGQRGRAQVVYEAV